MYKVIKEITDWTLSADCANLNKEHSTAVTTQSIVSYSSSWVDCRVPRQTHDI